MSEQSDLTRQLATETEEFFEALETAKAKLEQLIATKDKIMALKDNVAAGVQAVNGPEID